MEDLTRNFLIVLVALSLAMGILSVPLLCLTGDARFLLATGWGLFIWWNLVK